MPRRFALNRADNPVNADPHVGLIKSIIRTYPALGITTANTKVVSIVPAETLLFPLQAQVITDTNGVRYEFLYNREDLGTLMKTFAWTSAQLTQVQAMTNSVDLCKLLQTKLARNFPAVDIWQDATYIAQATDSTTQKGFWVKALDSSPWYRGKRLISLSTTTAP